MSEASNHPLVPDTCFFDKSKMQDKSSLSLSHASLSVFPIRRNGGGLHVKREERRLAHMREQVHHHLFVRILLNESPQGGFIFPHG